MSNKKPRHRINGWINLNKPLELSSAGAVNKLKWLWRPEKIGHAGTLDPLATGVLPIALGEGTKCVNLLMDAKKIYEFTVTFGERRSTDDAEGEVLETSAVMPSEIEIRAVLPQFTGPIQQVPPAYSAIKVNGERAYALARAGEEVVLKSREVTIHALELLGYEALPKASSPCGRRLEEGAGNLPHYLSSAQQEQALEHAKTLRQDMTEMEKRLWSRLRDRQAVGHKFRRQQPIEQYIVDFVCFEERLIVELDGGQHSPEADAARTAYLQSQGFTILRFWNHEVLENMDGVMQAIVAQLGQVNSAPSPNPLPQGERAFVAHFRATVSKGTYIRSLGRDIAAAAGALGYISRLHRAAVGPFRDTDAISLDFLEKTDHKTAPILPLGTALDDIPALAIDGVQHTKLRHGQAIRLSHPVPPAEPIGVLHEGQLVALGRTDGLMLYPVRLLNL